MKQSERASLSAQKPPGEEHFRMMAASVQDYAIVMLDVNGHVTSWNLGAERIMGYREDEIVGQHVSRLYPREDVELGNPERELAGAAAEGRFEDENWRVRKDGTRLLVNVVVTAVRDDANRLRGFAEVKRDITASRVATDRHHTSLPPLGCCPRRAAR